MPTLLQPLQPSPWEETALILIGTGFDDYGGYIRHRSGVLRNSDLNSIGKSISVSTCCKYSGVSCWISYCFFPKWYGLFRGVNVDLVESYGEFSARSDET